MRSLKRRSPARARAAGRSVTACLEEQLGLDPAAFISALADYTGIAAMTIAGIERFAPAFDLLPFAEAQSRELLLMRDGTRLLAVSADPFNLTRRTWLEERAGVALEWRIAHFTEVAAWLGRHEKDLKAMDGLLDLGESARAGSAAEDLSLAAINAHVLPVVKLVDSTLYDALSAGASDIHLECGVDGMHIKYRLDGVLSAVGSAAGIETAEQVISRIKVMAELDIAERRVPQDGRFKVRKGGRDIDFRVSIMPSVFGEDAVLRILDKQGLAEANRGITLASLGFSGRDRAVIRDLASAPYGMLLVTGPTGTAKAAATTALKPGVWQNVAVSVAGGKITFYIDGAAAGSGDFALADVAGAAVLGEGFKGELDEAGLSGVARAQDYIRARAVAEMAESPLVVAEEKAGGEEASYMGILLGALTVDGWVVVGILAVMFVISVWVMITKTSFILKAQKGNDFFVKRFREKSAQLLTPGDPEAAALANEKAVRHSPMYRIYTIGLSEIAHRFEQQARAGKTHKLSLAALEAIRASMDAGIVREGQRLNSQIVLLTIAIAGGPFLGLLGTVVGVMITFAAIAAAGDVNVNAIAPGIAAALVATVAGLGVAIPALFGYNWLASKIKEVTSDILVFSDEFRTKSAELYEP